MQRTMNLSGRIMMGSLFLMAGLSKIGSFGATQGYMEVMGVPGAFLPLVIALEVGGAVALIVGWQTRLMALALAGFSLSSAVIFHHNFADQVQMIMFMKNLAIAGGLLAIAAQDRSQTLSLDWRRLVTSSR